jgi:hypothetical protein
MPSVNCQHFDEGLAAMYERDSLICISREEQVDKDKRRFSH